MPEPEHSAPDACNTPPIVAAPGLKPVSFSDLPGWADDDHRAALACLLKCRELPAARASSPRKSDNLALLGISSADLAGLLQSAPDPAAITADVARQFFEARFKPALVVLSGDDSGFVTGYFEPILDASPVPTDRFRFPLYQRPGDLVETGSTQTTASDAPEPRFGRNSSAGFGPYHDRSAIRRGALEGRGLELAWLDDPVDQYFVHIQGSVRLRYPDGRMQRLSYAAKNGFPYTSIGALLIDMGEIAAEDMSAETLRQWLADNPDRRDEVMDRNRSYIFFQPFTGDDGDSGPVGASGVALSAGRSLAVDPAFHRYATPIYVAVEQSLVAADAPFQRLMVAQDTGSAITGPARGDLFIGSGKQAGRLAGMIRHAAQFFVLVPVPDDGVAS